MPINVIDKIKQKNNGKFALLDAMDIAVDDTDKRLDTKLAEQDNEIEQIKAGVENAGSAVIPFFDLAAMGLPPVKRNGASLLEIDTADMISAFESGHVKMAFDIDGEGRHEFIMHYHLYEGHRIGQSLCANAYVQVIFEKLIDKTLLLVSMTDFLPLATKDDSGKIAAIVDGVWSKVDPPSGLPEVTEEDNGKVLTVADGRWAAAEAASGMTIPVYDLSAMGLPNIEIGNMNGVFAEVDTTQLMQDIAGGVVTFKMNFNFDGQTLGAVKTCGGIVVNDLGIATVTGIDQIGDIAVYSVLILQDGAIGAMAYFLDSMITSLIDAYMEDALGGDY